MRVLLSVLLILSLFVAACGRSDKKPDEILAVPEDTGGSVSEEDLARQIEKGYDLPVDIRQRKEAEEDCKKVMELTREIYVQADKGNASNIVLSDGAVSAMRDRLKETGRSVITTQIYASMEDHESVDKFLKECSRGVSGSATVYEIHSSGSIGRLKFIFDGTDMYVLSASVAWDDADEPRIAYVSYTRIKEWRYTEKGWFCYELCVPEPPEVTEIVDGSCMLRIKPIADENRKIAEKCLLALGYQGNDLLCSDWDPEHVEDLDHNGLYGYLYAMKYGEKFESADHQEGIPREEFESLMMEYLPITREEIRRYAVFNEEDQTYRWERSDCFNYAPTYFGTSFPEVTQIKENEDGTVTLTVDAVCRMILCDDAVMTHEITIRFFEDGSFKYLKNKIVQGS